MPASGQIIISAINEFLSSPRNSLQTISGEKAWEEALIGFSSGGDPLYQQLKSDIGSFYWTPLEIFSLSFPEIPVRPEDLTVISWVLPQTAATREDQRRQKISASPRLLPVLCKREMPKVHLPLPGRRYLGDGTR